MSTVDSIAKPTGKSGKKKKSSDGTPKKTSKSSADASPLPPATPEPSTNPLFSLPEKGFIASIEDSLADMVEQDVVVQWFSSLMSPTTRMIEPDKSAASAAAGQLPSAVVSSATPSRNTSSSKHTTPLVAQVSQNERWSVWGKWGASNLLPLDPGAFSTADLRVNLPLEGIDPEALVDGPKLGLWAPPPGFEWAPTSTWTLDVEGDDTADSEHDVDRCECCLSIMKYSAISLDEHE
jgi:hypothetical protein